MNCKLIYMSIAVLAMVGRANADPQTGPFETQFTQRSPLSEMKSLTTRLLLKPSPTADYDLATMHFHVYVPEAYDAAKPMGLMVLVNYKPSETLPLPVLSQFADANMAFVVAREMPEDWWQRAGLALDAVHNMQATYAIDPKRIYVMGSQSAKDHPDEHSHLAVRLGLFVPEVFTGTVSIYSSPSWRKISGGNNYFYFPEIPSPPARSMPLAQQHPIVFYVADNQPKQMTDAYVSGGFKHVKVAPLSVEQYHYPNYTTDWLPDCISFLDATTATLKLPATRPATTKPATTKPAATTRPAR